MEIEKVCNTVRGIALSPFQSIKTTFRENYELGLEAAGSAFAVFQDGKLVVDLYGGYSDVDKRIPWQYDTLTVFFSATKSLTSIVLAMLISQKLASYDDFVCTYWPEFASYGKNGITIKHVVQHQAGLPYGNKMLNIDDVMIAENMSKVLEQMVPLWKPGTTCGYHALTFGFLVDQIVRRIDVKKRGVACILREEILLKHGIEDIFIGLPNIQMNSRVTQIVELSEKALKLEKLLNPEGVRLSLLTHNEPYRCLYDTWPWIKLSEYNNPKKRCLQMPSNMGIGTARGLAKVHSLVVQGDLISNDVLKLISVPQLINTMDIINGYSETKGFGWQYNKNKLGKWNIGHSGQGGQNVRMDLDNKLAYAYLCNGLKACDSDHVYTFRRLQDTLYQYLSFFHPVSSPL
ncbi:unnamed protein product [Thelazia callipaeda]|uniref:Beta-lactamase domain-containing protein n=1 Tax=Thelazia callipaeda TaxID=103827 RepID=A0A0N5CS42_THECL|nr:unnamed protein product [Thelazia callipaeda]